MTNLAHIAETALLLLAAYLLGCAIGYCLRMVLHAARGTRRVVPAAALATPVPEIRQPRSSAARLAARAGEAPPLPKVTPPLPVGPAPAGAATQLASTPPRPSAASEIATANRGKSADARPAALDQPRGDRGDNLKQIKGIGPKIEASLYALGIFHIDQIAAWTKANVDWVDARLAFKGRIRRERWVEQAQQLSAANAGAPARLSSRA